MNPTYVTFLFYLTGMLIVGIITYRMTHTLSDYMIAGRGLNKWVVALSAQASDMSGWLLLGLPGAAYASGLGTWSIWISIGLATGTMLNWQYVAKRLRCYTEVFGDSITLSEYFAHRFKDTSNVLRIISALFILIFFLFYTASGLVAGGKLFEATFGVDYTTALLIGAFVIVAYTFMGGFFAVSWSDFFQGGLMFFALIIAPVLTVRHLGGLDAVLSTIYNANPDLLDVAADVTYAAEGGGVWSSAGSLTAVGIISAMAWGLGYFGQPHILVRFMAIKSLKDIKTSRLISMIWVVFTLYGAVLAGFVGIAAFGPGNALADPEWVFMEVVQLVFNPWIAGVLLAAVLAAIMSTIDSQLLVSSSALTEDFYHTFFKRDASQQELIWVGRFAVLIIAALALVLAFGGGQVLELVAYAWAGFGASFGPAVLFSLFWRRMTKNGALVGMIVGGVTVILWQYTGSALYEIVPGFIFSAIAIVMVSLMDKEPAAEVLEEFDRAQQVVREN
ncbi:sodium/proline symporter PutP [Dethiobacter alkaliphilus]|uniref:sodium/proline symporter PutP n=1 Tax=Dethiobacter alkaliphilus TaxID=427926 RepID=UPI002227DCFF|nr:sodium/proline symporter PutP [Dethiobacter alkaliphilus]MCW3489277.1 sodium/proline symporter PutP [Dethiobacter alkaliphilus]